MNNWKKAVLTDTATMRDAMEAIDQSSLQVVVVVDDRGRLVGTITDGDVRRGILRGIGFNASVRDIMNKKPESAKAHQSRDEILSLMKHKKIHQIPILDED